MARLQRLGRAHSHEGVTGGYYHTDPEEDGELVSPHASSLFKPFSYLNPLMALVRKPEGKRGWEDNIKIVL
jgi:hypothetical protein